MFSGKSFVILTLFFCGEVAWFFCRDCVIFVWRGCVIFCEKRMRNFLCEEVSGCVIFLTYSLKLHDFFSSGGCVIFFVERLREFLVSLCDFFCGDLAWFLGERLHDFFSGQVGWFFYLICCVIMCVERLRDFCAWRGFVIFLTHSLRLHDSFFWRLRDFFCKKVLCFFGWEIAWFFLGRGCLIFSVKRLHNFLCEEVF